MKRRRLPVTLEHEPCATIRLALRDGRNSPAVSDPTQPIPNSILPRSALDLMDAPHVLEPACCPSPAGTERLNCSLVLVTKAGKRFRRSFRIAIAGEQTWSGSIGSLRFQLSTTPLKHERRSRIVVTIHNPNRAYHRDGYWDLGDPGSCLIDELSLIVGKTAPESGTPTCAELGWQVDPAMEPQLTSAASVTIYQESSGGENWYSRNHLNRAGTVPMAIRGYRVTDERGKALTEGLRATPVVAMLGEETYLACAVEEFWQRFPTAIEVTRQAIRVGLLPAQFPDSHELQAGEKCTRVLWLQWGKHSERPWHDLLDVYSPAAPSPQSVRDRIADVIAPLPPTTAALRPECRQLLQEALEGTNSFFAKREIIDEYGWRHFGDMWADHEEAYCEDPKPVISHYNNQYDLLMGLLVQYLITEDVRWWQLVDPLARHILDIDIYDTTHDKAAYNHGLFWHTDHYHDAATSTHRSYSRAMMDKGVPSAGGGPCNEHNYATGLLIYHLLTGDPRARDAVVGLADWVIAMDDGPRHVFGIVSHQPTGFASSTAQAEYHGPGRGSGNSINVLLDAWLLTRSGRYLAKTDELIRRTIHPADDIDSHNLLDAELRWSYTVHLQALYRYLTVVPAQSADGVPSEMWYYVRQSLLHYARWMTTNERLYLDHREQLEYPTETWAAQDLRKGVVLLMAASVADEPDRQAMQRKGREILDLAWRQLMQFPSRTCTRPLAIVLQQCWLEQSLVAASPDSFPRRFEHEFDFGRPKQFVSQRQHVRLQLRSLRGMAQAASCAVNPFQWKRSFGHAWHLERLRRWIAALRTADKELPDPKGSTGP